jgi:hypothetical protein
MEEGLKMRTLRSKISTFAVLGGIAAMALVAGGSAASASVCGTRADGPKTYATPAAAKADGAKVAHMGDCLILCQGFGPTIIQQPMCGMDPLNHAKMTYPNNCEAENAKAIWVHDGPCKK